eukprot:g8124.t1
MTEVVLTNMGFNYPIVLSSFYTAINWAGTAVFRRERKASKLTFDRRQWTLASLLSVCTALNTLIGRANIAVPTTFDQMLQAVGPLLVLLLATRVFKRSVSRERKVAVIPIVIGVAMAWYSEMEISGSAVWVSVVCIVLNAIKVVINSEMLTGEYKVTPLHLLSRVSPMTLAQVATFAVFHGEVAGMLGNWKQILAGWAPHVIALTGFVSFVLTVLSMHATKFATPLTVSVMGALKQILVAAFTVYKMQRSVSRLNVVGLVLALIGAVRYTVISRRERKMREKRDAISPGLAKKERSAKPKPESSYGSGSGSGSGSAAPLLPVTVKNPAPTHGSILVNGKRSGKRGGGWSKGKGGRVDGEKAKAKAWSWWNGKSGDASRRDR